MLRDLNQTRKMLNYVRCDNAKKFLSSDFEVYLSTQGTVSWDIPEYSTELHGTARINCTIIKSMRFMLKVLGHPRIYERMV